MFYSEIIQNESSLICIEDNISDRSTCFVRDFINGHVKESGNVHIYCYDKNSKSIKQFYGSSSNHFYYDISSSEDLINSKWSFTIQKYSFLSQLKPNSTDRCYTIIIDSLTGLLVHQNFEHLYRELNKLISKKLFKTVFNVQIVAIVHSDTLPESNLVLEHLKRLSKVWISMKTTNLAKISVKRNNGILDTKEYSYSVDNDGNITGKTEIIQSVPKTERTPIEPKSTFNLKLTEAEKIARKNAYNRSENEITNSNTGMQQLEHVSFLNDIEEGNDWDFSDEEDDY